MCDLEEHIRTLEKHLSEYTLQVESWEWWWGHTCRDGDSRGTLGAAVQPALVPSLPNPGLAAERQVTAEIATQTEELIIMAAEDYEQGVADVAEQMSGKVIASLEV